MYFKKYLNINIKHGLKYSVPNSDIRWKIDQINTQILFKGLFFKKRFMY